MAFFLLTLVIPLAVHAGQFKVTRVYDGDTVKAEGYEVEIKVRLVGIDAPETSKSKRQEGQPFSQQATKFLAGLVLNKVVDIKGYGMDGYGRVLGVITADGNDVNLEMVRAGYAEVYRGKAPHGFDQEAYLRAEQEAREGKRGMWTLGGRYVSPREWRRME